MNLVAAVTGKRHFYRGDYHRMPSDLGGCYEGFFDYRDYSYHRDYFDYRDYSYHHDYYYYRDYHCGYGYSSDSGDYYGGSYYGGYQEYSLY